VQTSRIVAGHRPANRGRVLNRVTPQGVWKHLHTPPCCVVLPFVLNRVTPQGVWKISGMSPSESNRMVLNRVTPRGVWKLHSLHEFDRVDVSETESRHRAYGNPMPPPWPRRSRPSGPTGDRGPTRTTPTDSRKRPRGFSTGAPFTLAAWGTARRVRCGRSSVCLPGPGQMTRPRAGRHARQTAAMRLSPHQCRGVRWLCGVPLRVCIGRGRSPAQRRPQAQAPRPGLRQETRQRPPVTPGEYGVSMRVRGFAIHSGTGS
jgi:hypothetical protein